MLNSAFDLIFRQMSDCVYLLHGAGILNYATVESEVGSNVQLSSQLVRPRSSASGEFGGRVTGIVSMGHKSIEIFISDQSVFVSAIKYRRNIPNTPLLSL